MRCTSTFVLLIIVSATTSCSHYAQIPASEYVMLDESPAHGYRVVTTDGRVYMVKQLSIKDGYIVVHEMRPNADMSHPSVPFVLDRESIDRIDRIEVNYASPIVLGVALIAAAIAIGHFITFGPFHT